MQLVINTYGSYLRKNGDCFLVKNEDKVFEVSVRKVDSIIACRTGYDVLYTKAAKMFRYLNGGRADNSWETRIKRHTVTDLLIIDDFGLKSLTPLQSDDFYEVINER